jgi:hypothetical protein
LVVKEKRRKQMPLSYNPKAVIPTMRGKFHSAQVNATQAEILEAKRRMALEQQQKRAGPPPRQNKSYKEIWETLMRGEGHMLGHYGSEMTFDLHPGMEDKFIDGAWDTHAHVFPDYVPRRIDIIDYAIEGSKAHMGGIICKDHFFTTIGQAWGAQCFLDDLVKRGELDYTCKVYGTHILAWSLHPDQVHIIRQYPNLGAVFFNTWTGLQQNYEGSRHACGPAINIIDGNDKITPEAKECIDLCAEYKIPMMTGHRIYEDNYAIVKEAARVGHAEHILVTHAESHAGTPEQTKELAEMGAQMEMNAAHAIPGLIMPMADANYFPHLIEFLGPEHCHLNTDWGQPIAQDPLDGLRLFIVMLMHWGFSDKDIRVMSHDNPEKYMFLK